MNMKQAEIATELVRAIKITKSRMSDCSLEIAKKQAEMIEYAKRLAIMEKDLESL